MSNIKISRLRKKSSETIELYHVTSSQSFMQIANDGQIVSGNSISTTSNGADGKGAPSGSENGIYLAGDPMSAIENYGYGAINNSIDENMPNIATILCISVSTDNLIPDYDDWSNDEDGDIEENLLWEKCLEEIGQCVHNGPINISSVKWVEFDREIKKSGTVLNSSQIVNNLSFGTELSVSTAYSEIEYLHSLVN